MSENYNFRGFTPGSITIEFQFQDLFEEGELKAVQFQKTGIKFDWASIQNKEKTFFSRRRSKLSKNQFFKSKSGAKVMNFLFFVFS